MQKKSWTEHFRRQVRRPKVLSRDETQAPSAAPSAAESPKQSRTCTTRGGKLWQPKPPCKRFGGRMNFRLPNLSSSRTQFQRQTISFFPSTSQTMQTSPPQHTYTHVYDHRGPKLANNPKQQNKHNIYTCIHA